MTAGRPRRSAAAIATAWGNPSLRRLQLAFALSATMQWAASLAVAVYLFDRGGASAVAAGLVARWLPSALAAPVMATFADRHPRVRVMVASDLARVVLVAGSAALLATDAPLAAIYAVGALTGIAGTAFEPAKAALLPSLAREPSELTAANVVSSGIDSVSFFVGPALGGLALAVASPPAALLVTAAAFGLSAVLVTRIREERRPSEDTDGEDGSFARELAAGFRAVGRTPGVALVIGLLTAQTFVSGVVAVLLPALALDVLDIGGGGLGALEATIGVGAVLGVAAAAVAVRDQRLAVPFIAGALLWGLPFVLLGAVPAVAVAVAVLALVGLGNSLIDVSGITLLQRLTPEPVLGRVFGVLEASALGGVALGAAIAPVLIGAFGIDGALIAAGAVLPVVIAVRLGALLALDARTQDPARAADVALLRDVPIFAPLDQPVLERLAGALTRRTGAPGEAIIVQGDAGDAYFLVAAGAVDIEADGEIVGRLGPGGTFGEIALLHDVPRTATVRASEPTDLRVLAREDFLAAVTAHAGSLRAAREIASGRMRDPRPLAAA